MSMKTYPIGRIYQIINDVDDLKFIGSTGQTLSRRMTHHRTASRQQKNTSSFYQHMRAIGEGHFNILLVEQTGPITREALRALEHKHIVAFDSVRHGLNDRYESKFCEHNRRRAECATCEGSAICEHKRQRQTCIDCGGSNIICEHKRRKAKCKECKGDQICLHNRERSHCVDCEGSQICQHKRRKARCKECSGSGVCEHNKRRERCVDCGGSELCKFCLVTNNPEHRRTANHIYNFIHF